MGNESRYVNGTEQPLRFLKMRGTGNDFVVVDARDRNKPVTSEVARRIGDRTRNVGFDQLVVISGGQDGAPALALWNADGSVEDACGNGTRCVAQLLLDGGELHIDWRSDGVWMTGPTELVFEGIIPAEFLETER
jgi:diaminopimelate epimerase